MAEFVNFNRSLSISSKDSSDRARTKSLGKFLFATASGDATDAEKAATALALAQKIVGLTTNTFNSVYVTEKKEAV